MNKGNPNNQQKILIVEDEIIIGMDLKEKLESFGYLVTEIVTLGKDAISSAEKELPDLVLMDIRIKGEIDGVETASILKKKFNIPVVFLTAFIDDETVERARNSAPEGYLIKPIHDKELEITIKMSLHKSFLEKKVKQNQILMNTILSNVADGIISIDSKFNVLFANTSACNLLKVNAGEIIGKNIDELFLIIDESVGKESFSPSGLIEDNFIDEISLNDRLSIQTKHKTSIPAQIKFSIIHDENNSPKGYIYVVTDITERRENESKRRKLMNELKSKKNELEQIISFASNDLRPPLINILGFSREMMDTLNLFSEKLTLLKNNELKEFDEIEEVKKDLLEFTNFIQDSGNKLSLMFNGLLELSNSEKRESHIEEIDTNELLKTIIKDLSFRMNQRDITIEVDNLKNIFGDKLLLSQVFGNILDNAIKFSKPRGRNKISISQEEDDDKYIFCIADTGIGIEDNFKERVFGYFAADANNKFRGHGLGLAIVKKIIEKHSGDIWFESELNVGTKFFFTIPKIPVK
ncbi:MAG: ATP-binding protein [Ignavibacteria bacterium]|jgi:PAS domain S-box-containing protein